MLALQHIQISYKLDQFPIENTMRSIFSELIKSGMQWLSYYASYQILPYALYMNYQFKKQFNTRSMLDILNSLLMLQKVVHYLILHKVMFIYIN